VSTLLLGNSRVRRCHGASPDHAVREVTVAVGIDNGDSSATSAAAAPETTTGAVLDLRSDDDAVTCHARAGYPRGNCRFSAIRLGRVPELHAMQLTDPTTTLAAPSATRTAPTQARGEPFVLLPWGASCTPGCRQYSASAATLCSTALRCNVNSGNENPASSKRGARLAKSSTVASARVGAKPL
jgi:hypothetical protein